MWKKLREKQRNRQECTTAAAVVRILGGKFLEVHTVAIFSFLIEFTQLLFHLGTLQISDLTYNTLGGAVGGVIYYLGYSRKTKEIK